MFCILTNFHTFIRYLHDFIILYIQYKTAFNHTKQELSVTQELICLFFNVSDSNEQDDTVLFHL